MKNQIKKISKSMGSKSFSINSFDFGKFSKPLFLCALVLVVSISKISGSPVKAQDSTLAELKVKTSAICGMCKETIEEALAFEKGVKKSDLDVKSKIITVTYNPKKTTPEKIRTAIANSGYDADDVPANPKAYKKLSGCCKKDKAPH